MHLECIRPVNEVQVEVIESEVREGPVESWHHQMRRMVGLCSTVCFQLLGSELTYVSNYRFHGVFLCLLHCELELG